jgi:hypothetical protein
LLKPKKNPWLIPGGFICIINHLLRYYGLRLSLLVVLDTPHVTHSGGTDQETGHLELASHQQVTSLKRMLKAAHAGFDGGTDVMAIFAQFLTVPSPF